MFEQFSNYPGLEWMAAPAAQGYRGSEKIQNNPNLENFKLVRFVDLRKHPKVNAEYRFQLMLFGNSKTNIFIAGSGPLLDEMVARLPKYIGKSWTEIKNMSLERDFLNCKNAYAVVCDPRVSDDTEHKPVGLGRNVPEVDLDKIDEICAKCEHFEFDLER